MGGDHSLRWQLFDTTAFSTASRHSTSHLVPKQPFTKRRSPRWNALKRQWRRWHSKSYSSCTSFGRQPLLQPVSWDEMGEWNGVPTDQCKGPLPQCNTPSLLQRVSTVRKSHFGAQIAPWRLSICCSPCRSATLVSVSDRSFAGQSGQPVTVLADGLRLTYSPLALSVAKKARLFLFANIRTVLPKWSNTNCSSTLARLDILYYVDTRPYHYIARPIWVIVNETSCTNVAQLLKFSKVLVFQGTRRIFSLSIGVIIETAHRLECAAESQLSEAKQHVYDTAFQASGEKG